MTSIHALLPEAPLAKPLPAVAGPPFVEQIGAALGLDELLRLRQVHALEHATIWVLTGRAPAYSPTASNYCSATSDDGRFSGISTAQGFYLTGDVSARTLLRATRAALKRLDAGEWSLAIHPRCGTNVSVAAAVLVGLSLTASVLLPRRPLEQCLGIGAAAIATAALAPALGAIAQQHLTTALPANLIVERVYPVQRDADADQPNRHFVQVKWLDTPD